MFLAAPVAAGRGSLRAEVDKFCNKLKPATPKNPKDPDSLRTWRRHYDFVTTLDHWVKALGPDTQAMAVTTRAIQDVLDRWQTDGKSTAILLRRRTYLGSFYRSLLVGLDNAVNPVRGTTKYHDESQKDSPDTLDPDVVVQVLESMEPSPTKARLGLMFATGPRQSEIMRLQPQDFDLEGTGSNGSGFSTPTPSVHYRRPGKGGRARHVPLTALGLEYARLFVRLNAFGTFSVQAMRLAFINAAVRVGIPKETLVAGKTKAGRTKWRFKPYAMRHTFATYVRQHGDLADVGRLLGHVNGSKQTQRYAAFDHDKTARMVLGSRLAAIAAPQRPESLDVDQLPLEDAKALLERLQARVGAV